MDLSLGLLAVTGVMHEADGAYSIQSTWSCYWLDLSAIYFAHFSEYGIICFINIIKCGKWWDMCVMTLLLTVSKVVLLEKMSSMTAAE